MPTPHADLEVLKDTARRWILGLWNEQDFTLLTELASPDYLYRIPGKEEVRAEGMPAYVGRLHGAMPDLENTIESQVAEGGTVVTIGTVRGTHTAPLGDVPPTGNAVAVPWVMVTRFSGGRIVEDAEYYDDLLFLRQLGIMP